MSYLRPNRFEIIAHRGGSLEAPENTLIAFEHARNIYSDTIFELDVHRTTDGEIVVFHDDDLSRVTNGTGTIWNHSYNELSRLDAAHCFTMDGGKTFPWRGKNVRIPKLTEVFEKFPASRVSVEFKHPSPFFGDKVVGLIREYKAENRVVLAGEDHASLVKAAALAPEMARGFSRKEIILTLLCNHVHLPRLGPARGRVLQVPESHGKLKIVTEDFIKKAHDRGIQIHVWTINDEATMRQLIEMGVDALITDAPSLLLRVAQGLKKF